MGTENCSDANLRDIAANIVGGIAPNRVFRASQFYSSLHTHRIHEIAAVLDLRKECSTCKSTSRAVLQLVWPRWAAEHDAAGNPTTTSCSSCESELNTQSGKPTKTKVFHIDLVTPGFKRNVFLAVPYETQLQALRKLLTLRSPEAMFAEKCADPEFIGYEKLYVLFLEHSKKKLAQVFCLLAGEDNYPVLIHCIHGKDRTGVVVMLLLLLCGVEKEYIVQDYMFSSRCMSAWKENGNASLKPHLQTAKVLSVAEEYIDAAIEHIQSVYGGVDKYLISCGVSIATQEAVKGLLQSNPSAEVGSSAEGAKHVDNSSE